MRGRGGSRCEAIPLAVRVISVWFEKEHGIVCEGNVSGLAYVHGLVYQVDVSGWFDVLHVIVMCQVCRVYTVLYGGCLELFCLVVARLMRVATLASLGML